VGGAGDEERSALGDELHVLEAGLRAKEEKMRALSTGGHHMVALKQHYDCKLEQMEAERTALSEEKLQLLMKVDALQVNLHRLPQDSH
jgi:hypothetical protein